MLRDCIILITLYVYIVVCTGFQSFYAYVPVIIIVILSASNFILAS
jgi:hypothetical protein